MKTDTPELFFAARELFREWLAQNWDTSGGIWLAFDKSKARKSLSANEALEEARERDFEKIIDRRHKSGLAYRQFAGGWF